MVSNKGFNEGLITMYYRSGEVGSPVTITENNACTEAADGDSLVGILVNSRGEVASVQVMGFAKVNYSGTAPALGVVGVAADGNGGIKASANGRKVIVLSVNTDNSTAEIIL